MPSIWWSKYIRATTGCCIPALFQYAAIGQLTKIRYLLPPGVPLFNATQILLPIVMYSSKCCCGCLEFCIEKPDDYIFRKLLQIDSKCCTRNLGIDINVIDWVLKIVKREIVQIEPLFISTPILYSSQLIAIGVISYKIIFIIAREVATIQETIIMLHW